MPGLKVNETLRWEVPMTYRQGRVGLLVLLYKAIVLAPVVAAFVGYRRHVVAQAERRHRAVHEIVVTSLDGREHRMEEYKGRVLLIVNVASECGHTPQYAGLEALHQRHRNRGFLVLGFPCNQFGAQEPGTNAEIGKFCRSTHGVRFPMFAKVDVNGPAAHPLFQWLKAAQPGLLGTQAIKWNFTKFLVDQAGQVVKRYGPATTPDAIEQDVQAHLHARVRWALE